MCGRYYVTGVQIGVLLAFAEMGNFIDIKSILLEIEENQFLGSV